VVGRGGYLQAHCPRPLLRRGGEPLGPNMSDVSRSFGAHHAVCENARSALECGSEAAALVFNRKGGNWRYRAQGVFGRVILMVVGEV